ADRHAQQGEGEAGIGPGDVDTVDAGHDIAHLDAGARGRATGVEPAHLVDELVLLDVARLLLPVEPELADRLGLLDPLLEDPDVADVGVRVDDPYRRQPRVLAVAPV